MPTDDERREAAGRLKSYVSEWRDMPSFSVQKGVACSLGIVRFDVESQLLHLADLIEPSEPKVRCVAEVKVDGERLEELVHDAAAELTGIDRDELLNEVKELEKCAWYFGLDFDEDEPLRDRLKEASEAFAGSACRIREALGVVA